MDIIKFSDRLNSLRYQHAVVQCGQKLLHLIMITLIRGDINNITECVKEAVGSSTKYKNSFTKDEQRLLEKGHHKSWDISLLYKIIQKVCGLHPAGSHYWTQNTGGDDLEFFITTLKDIRNELVHKFDYVISENQVAHHLNELTELALKLTSALGERSQALGTQLYVIQNGKQLSDIDFETTETLKIVYRIIEDVKENINESQTPSGAVPEAIDSEEESDDEFESDDLQCDNVYVAAGAGGQASKNPSMEELLEDLTRKFWKYAGPKDVDI